MIIDLTAIWQFFVAVIMPLLSVFSIVYLIRLNHQWMPTLKVAKKIIRQWGSMMSEKKGDKKEFQKLTEAQKSGRAKLVKEIKSRMPMKLLDGHTESEVIGLLQDQELMKGLIFIGQTGQKFLEKIAGVFSAKEQKKHGLDKIPTIQ